MRPSAVGLLSPRHAITGRATTGSAYPFAIGMSVIIY